MAYQENIPQGTDRISKSQADILGNFTALAPFGNGYVDLTVQNPAPTFPGTDTGIYAFLDTDTGVSETYINKYTVDAPSEVPFSASIMSYTAMAGCGNGWSYLPSGLLIKWGTVAVAAGTSVNITPTVTSGGPDFNAVFSVMLSPLDTGALTTFVCGQRTVAAAPSGNFTAYVANPSATTSIVYMVMGV